MRNELPQGMDVLQNVWLITGVLADTYSGVGERRKDAEKSIRFAIGLGVPWKKVVSPIRRRDYVEVRQLVSYYLKDKGWTYREIGEFLGGRDHSTSVYAVRVASGLLEVDKDIQHKYIKLLQA